MASSPPLSDAALPSISSQTMSFTDIDWEATSDDEYEYEYISEEEEEKGGGGGEGPRPRMSFTDIDWEATSDDEYEYEYISEEEEDGGGGGEEGPRPRTLEPPVLIRSVTTTTAEEEEEEEESTASSSSVMLSSVVDESMCGHCGRETHAPVDCETLRLWHTTDSSGVVVMPSTLLTPVLHQLVKQVATQWNIPPVAAATLLYDVNWDAGQLTTHSMGHRGTNFVGVELASGVVNRDRVHRASMSTLDQMEEQTLVRVEMPFDVLERDRVHRAAVASLMDPMEELTMNCEICMETDVPVDQMVSMPCRHAYCKECWADFFTRTVEIMDATVSRCLRMQCPHAQCNERVTEEEIRKSAPDLLPHFQEQQFSSFLTGVGNSRYARSCPGTECNYIAVSSRFHRFGNTHGRALPVSCGGCSTEFCFTCGEAPHDFECRVTHERHKKESYHKNCPRCQVHIEKTGGCNHMTCRCGYEFCWLCLGDYSRGIHSCGIEWGQGLDVLERGGLRRGGLGRGLGRDIMNAGLYDWEHYRMHVQDLPSFDLEYVCDTLAGHYGSDLPEGASLVLEKKKEITRFSHYFDRYEAHGQGQRYAACRTTDVALQRDAFFQLPDISSGTDADFLSMANERLVIVRRFLKYSYILAYFLVENTDLNRMQKDFFQHRQAMLERFTEELSRVSENATSQLDKSQVVNLMGIVEKCLMNLLEFMHGIPKNES